MRGLTIITVLFASLTFVNVSFTEQKKDQPKKDDTPIEVNASYLEKTGALKFKSASKGSVTNPAIRWPRTIAFGPRPWPAILFFQQDPEHCVGRRRGSN